MRWWTTRSQDWNPLHSSWESWHFEGINNLQTYEYLKKLIILKSILVITFKFLSMQASTFSNHFFWKLFFHKLTLITFFLKIKIKNSWAPISFFLFFFFEQCSLLFFTKSLLKKLKSNKNEITTRILTSCFPLYNYSNQLHIELFLKN